MTPRTLGFQNDRSCLRQVLIYGEQRRACKLQVNSKLLYNRLILSQKEARELPLAECQLTKPSVGLGVPSNTCLTLDTDRKTANSSTLSNPEGLCAPTNDHSGPYSVSASVHSLDRASKKSLIDKNSRGICCLSVLCDEQGCGGSTSVPSQKYVAIFPPIHPSSRRCLHSPYTTGTTRSGAWFGGCLGSPILPTYLCDGTLAPGSG